MTPMELFARTLLALAVIGAVLVGFAYLVRALGTGRAGPIGGRGRYLRVVESRALTQSASMHLVEAAGRFFLVGAGANGVALLAEIGAEAITKAATTTADEAPPRAS